MCSRGTCHDYESSCHRSRSSCHYTLQRQPVPKYTYVMSYCPPVQRYCPPAPFYPQYSKNICNLPPTCPKY